MPSFMSVKNDFDSTSDIHPERIINVPGNVLRHSLFKKKHNNNNDSRKFSIAPINSTRLSNFTTHIHTLIQEK